MKRKSILAMTILLTFLISAIAGLQVLDVAKANWIFPPIKPATTPPTIIVDSPTNGSTYREGFVLDFLLSSPQWARGPGKPTGNIIGLSYRIDDQLEQPIAISDPYAARPDEYRRTVPIPASILHDGAHNLTVISYCETYFVPENSSSYNVETFKFSAICAVINFNMAVNPQLILLSVENKTYPTSNFAVNFSTDRLTSWIGYSLDNRNNITIEGNTTLAELTCGSHHLTIYANDTAGNKGKSDAVFFTIETSTPSPSLTFPPTRSLTQQLTSTPTPPNDYGGGMNNLPLIFGIVAFAALVAVVALVLLTKRGRFT
jgi:hypothetical protein